MKVYIVGKATHYSKFINNSILTSKMEDADLVIFTGGEDVNPELYNAGVNAKTWFNNERDHREIIEFEKALGLQKSMMGICRGSQLLTVLAGGKLVQDVNRHSLAGTHPITLEDGTSIEMTSTHHQMMYPFDMKKDQYRILAKAYRNFSDRYEFEQGNIKTAIECEPEIVYYPGIKALAIQGHPEQMSSERAAVKYINKLIHNIYG